VRGGAGGEILFSALSPLLGTALLISWLRKSVGVRCLCHVWQEAERAYLLWKARQVADEQGSGAVAVAGGDEGKEGEAKEALVDFAVNKLKGDLFPQLMEYMG
jgi:hypothetical protein